MTSTELENLVASGALKREPASETEIEALMHSGRARLTDAQNEALALESRFDLAYNAGHAIALAALRRLGYRSDKRYVVFQALTHTAATETATWRVLVKAHGERNLFEYEGGGTVNERLLLDLIQAVTVIEAQVSALLT